MPIIIVIGCKWQIWVSNFCLIKNKKAILIVIQVMLIILYLRVTEIIVIYWLFRDKENIENKYYSILSLVLNAY